MYCGLPYGTFMWPAVAVWHLAGLHESVAQSTPLLLSAKPCFSWHGLKQRHIKHKHQIKTPPMKVMCRHMHIHTHIFSYIHTQTH